jgi:hypothetical protein
MQAFLDDELIAVDRPTLAGVLDAGRRAAQQRGRVIIEVKRNGLTVDGSELDQPADMPEPGTEFRLLTAEPRSLVRTTFLDVADLLPPARTRLAAAAEKLHTGELPEACEHLSEALSAFDTVRSVIEQGPALLGTGVDAIAPDGGVLGKLGRLTSDLEAVRSALLAQDWSTLADLLEGELSSASQEWEGVLRGLADALRPAAGTGGAR